jgi:molybdopterin/thiamine biosynthesis adenylyltransferase
MTTQLQSSYKLKPGSHVVLVGLGNIGSPLVELLARMSGVNQLTLVDRDVYEKANLGGQSIQPEDADQPKALVQAKRAQRINPALDTSPVHASVENVPLGYFRSTVIIAGLDSKLARQHVNQIAWRLNIPWIDGGVAREGLLARVNVYVPGKKQPCLECSWGDSDYQNLEVRQPCQAEENHAHTGAPAFLGSLAGALLATECDKLLSGRTDTMATGKQVTYAAESHQLHTMSFRRNPQCRFDHESLHITPLRCDLANQSLGDFLKELGQATSTGDICQLRVDGHPFERQWRCDCGNVREVLKLSRRTTATERSCRRCGKTMEPIGFSMSTSLCSSQLTINELNQSVATTGLSEGDVVLVRNGAAQRGFELRAS